MSGVSLLRAETTPMAAPPELLELSRTGAAPFFYWEHPARGMAIAALGSVVELRASGKRRFEELSSRAQELLSRIRLDCETAEPCDGPLMVGGFGFSDRESAAREWREFPAACVMLPKLLWIRRQERCTLTRIWDPAREERPDVAFPPSQTVAAACESSLNAAREPEALAQQRARWRERVERARAMVKRGILRKVVLSRRIEIRRAGADPAGMLRTSRATRPGCFSFWFARAQTALFGSTPELLVRVEGERVCSGALAGSAPRGSSPEQDRALGEALLRCAKNLEEHEYVREAVRAALGTVAAHLQMPARPVLMRLPEAQHLFTPVEGRLRGPRTVIELAGLLHPTPAVCGVPREAARELIEREEPDRGWYAGTVGWMDRAGNGEFAVALRSALIDGPRMFLWAGAGIVAGSDPLAEFAETEAKFTALLRSSGIDHAG
jgi:menaquinone-specific isochorismate synthase